MLAADTSPGQDSADRGRVEADAVQVSRFPGEPMNSSSHISTAKRRRSASAGGRTSRRDVDTVSLIPSR